VTGVSGFTKAPVIVNFINTGRLNIVALPHFILPRFTRNGQALVNIDLAAGAIPPGTAPTFVEPNTVLLKASRSVLARRRCTLVDIELATMPVEARCAAATVVLTGAVAFILVQTD
jgi:hypothetical protein